MLIIDAEQTLDSKADNAAKITLDLINEENKNIEKLFNLINIKIEKITNLLKIEGFQEYKTDEYFNWSKSKDILKNINIYAINISNIFKVMTILSGKISELSNLFNNKYNLEVLKIKKLILKNKNEFENILKSINLIKNKIDKYYDDNKLNFYNLYNLYYGKPVNYAFMITILIFNLF